MPEAQTRTPDAVLRSFIDRFEPKERTRIRSVRTALRKRFPTANELAYDYGSFIVIAYSPTDGPSEAIFSISARVTGVSLYFNWAKALPDPKKLLRGSGKQVRFVALDSASRLADPDIDALVAAALAHAPVPFPASGKGRLIIRTADGKRQTRSTRKA